MSETDCDVIDAESLEELFQPTVEVPAALLLAAGCGCCCGTTRPPRNACC